jgi:cytosine/adenosine deaminase-related metal-dependent hydrolase
VLTVRMLINARNRSVAIEGDRIVREGGRYDLVLDCPDADAHPGLINAHDHLHRNHFGRLGRPTYANAYRWADDIQVRYRRRIARGRKLPRRQALLAGAWKNLFAGVTTVVHHDSWEPEFDRDFPIRVARVACADSLGMSERFKAPAAGPYCLHVAEGVDDVAANEVPTLAGRGLLNERLIAVHGVGVDPADIERFRRSGAALVWCPTSNHFLFGRSVPAKLLDGGTDLLLGSDSRLTGQGDLLDELQAARASRLLADERLTDAVGKTGALRLGLPEPSLEPGSAADLILVDRPLIEARARNVALTMVGGIPRVARPHVARRLGSLAERGKKARIGSQSRWINQENEQGKES